MPDEITMKEAYRALAEGKCVNTDAGPHIFDGDQLLYWNSGSKGWVETGTVSSGPYRIIDPQALLPTKPKSLSAGEACRIVMSRKTVQVAEPFIGTRSVFWPLGKENVTYLYLAAAQGWYMEMVDDAD